VQSSRQKQESISNDSLLTFEILPSFSKISKESHLKYFPAFAGLTAQRNLVNPVHTVNKRESRPSHQMNNGGEAQILTKIQI
jgi:hypothetical protein